MATASMATVVLLIKILTLLSPPPVVILSITAGSFFPLQAAMIREVCKSLDRSPPAANKCYFFLYYEGFIFVKLSWSLCGRSCSVCIQQDQQRRNVKPVWQNSQTV